MNNESITITLEPPTTEWCMSCGAEFHYSRGAMRCKCPECGEEKMRRGLKPIHNDVVGCYVTTGRFNLLSDEEQYQYVFTNLPREFFHNRRISFVISGEFDTDDLFDLANEIHSELSGYLHTSQLKGIEYLLEVFTEKFQEEQRRKRMENRRQELLSELYWMEEYLV